MKYIIVTGGVMSGLGKGITASSIGLILKAYGFNVTALKIDPYLNIDSGTMSPFEHGECYVLDDGSETDLDLGNYERFLHIRLTGDHSLTSGKVFEHILRRERKGDYLGKTIQIVPHVTDYIQEYIEHAAHIPIEGTKPDICIVELGGTIGDIEGLMYAEALSQLTRTKLEYEDYCFVHLSLVPLVGKDEIKTKPTQHSIKTIRSLGMFPDFLVLRSPRTLTDSEQEKVSRLCQVKKEHVIVNYNVQRIYDVPALLAKQNIHTLLAKRLKLSLPTTPNFKNYHAILHYFNATDTQKLPKITVGIVGKYTNMQDTYLSLIRALEMAAFKENKKLTIRWISCELDPKKLEQEIAGVDRVIIPGGFGIRGLEGMVNAVTLAKKLHKKILGICLGFQVIIIEHARTICKLPYASSTEFDTETPDPVIVPVANTNVLGSTMRLGGMKVKYSDLMRNAIYKTPHGSHRFRHRYGVNHRYKEQLAQNGITFDGLTDDGMISNVSINKGQIIGVQYHPELSPKADNVFTWFLRDN